MNNRIITILGVLQAFFVVTGYLALGLAMKVNGYPHKTDGEQWGGALFLRSYGMFLILLPIIWMLLSFKTREYRKIPESSIYISGTIICTFLIGMYLYVSTQVMG
jgi:hypothetical protein